ncbi:MAG TPA: hypothetical protein VJB90_02035 [Candidatus Nanoarchaeia archaeon]|nr:hypothetical protein [Candidatus Nanoarchaeia archaeon]
MATTIQISKKLSESLKNRKLYDKESYEEIIWDLIEDSLLLNEQTLKEIKTAEKQVREGRTVSFEEVKRKAGL